ncbi:peptidase family C50-domain-containing protein [Microdochium bolleyi]|uniref:separase n=1 Tax=Microdochium bolleyi TaxID=196109 RepID=A0A136JK16_9PEZI|nr:peptidase family C50-domain-containing protein [Microdochium bolleyi]
MAPSRAQVDVVRDGVKSASSCSSTISATLKQLLQDIIQDSSDATTKTAASARTTKTTARGTTSRATTRNAEKPTATNRASRTVTTPKIDNDESLPPKERAVLATQVINASLKALGEAAKSTDSAKPELSSEATEPPTPSTRKALRRSTSMPMAPLQPRALNKVSTLPMGDAQKPTSAASASVSNGCLALVECAHVAFTCLRTLQTAGAVALPELQLESGLSSFINKLIALRLHEHAFREIRVLKRRLDVLLVPSEGSTTKSKAVIPSASLTTTSKVFADLLDFPDIEIPGPLLSLITSTQLQALRILHGMNKTSLLSTVLPALRLSNATSPFQLTKRSLKTGATDASRCSKQLETLSQTVLSLTCSVSTKDDAIANEPKLSPQPEICLEAQSIALSLKLHAWKWTRNQGDVDREILLPFSKCLQAFSRRTSREPSTNYGIITQACSQLLETIEAAGHSLSKLERGPTTVIYEMLGAVSQEAGKFREAVTWMTKVKENVDRTKDTPARQCSVSSRLLSVLLKNAEQTTEGLITEVLDGLQGPLSGSTSELDELLLSVCNLRKAVMSTLVGSQKRSSDETVQQHLQSFILQLPRFCLRWMGKPPATPGATKELLRFEQRRQLLKKYVHLIIDSALMLLKVALDKEALDWETMDPSLQDVLGLLEHFEDTFSSSVNTNPANSYHVKVSHFYYQQHLILRKSATKSTETISLKALRRSVDCVKNVSRPERLRAQVLVKWERFAELCRASGRKEDAADAIRSIRDYLVRDETAQQIWTSLSTQSVSAAWRKTPETEALSRAVCNLAKLDKQPADWTWLFTGSEKVVALEHDLHYVYADDARVSKDEDAFNSVVQSLLDLYKAQKYPIRRLRTLLRVTLRLLGRDIDTTAWQAEIASTVSTISEDDLSEDAGLQCYISHLLSLATCTLAMAQGSLEDTNISEVLGRWARIVSQCTTHEQLCKHVDDPEQLLTVLQSLSDFARIKGMQLLSADALELSSKISQLSSKASQDTQYVHTSTLILQQLQMGHSSRARKMVSEGEDNITHLELASDASASFYLAAAEYYLAVGEYEKAEVNIAAAQDSASNLAKQSCKKVSGADKRMLTARACSIASLVALERGDSHHALEFAKTAVQTVFHDWARFESKSSSQEESSDVSQQASTQSNISLDTAESGSVKASGNATGPRFWRIACALFEYTNRLSWIFAHFGLYQETMYYAEQAQKIASTTQSPVYALQATAWLAFIHRSAGDMDKAVQLASRLLPTMNAIEPTYANVQALCQLSKIYHDTDPAIATDIVAKADYMIKVLAETKGVVQLPTETKLEDDMAKLSLAQPAASTARTRQTRMAKTTKTTRAKPAVTKTAIKRAPANPQAAPPAAVMDVLLRQLQAAVFQQQSLVSIKQKDWVAASAILEGTPALSSLSMDISEARFLQAVTLVGRSLEQMGHDSVFSVIQESTLSFPAVAASSKERSIANRVSLSTSPAPRRTAQEIDTFQEGLRRAQDYLLEAHSIAVRSGKGSLVHRVAVLLQSVSVLLTTTVSGKTQRPGHPAHATCSVEMARNLVWRREKKTLAQDSKKPHGTDWPILVESSDSRRSSLGPATDMAKFQRDFVDIIPRDWNVVSVSLGDGQHDLCITKLQAGHSPFAIRLPLERANSRDADIDVFDFHQGRSELLEIIKEINRTSHDARDMSQKGAKAEWWAEREALDERMKDLLDNVEQTWLGGFKGVFAPSQRRPELLARFQRSFLDILDKHLPSRRQVRGKKPKSAASGSKITLDPRIYELFVSLGDATVPDVDLDEPLNDLLYFVIDILQFNGERNAYDEIDFDAMVVDTFDAIHSYQIEAKSIAAHEQAHTILIVDKALHIFPWESLPCMDGSAVSRIPSLACLRRLILEQSIPGREEPQQAGPGHEQEDQMEVDDSTTTSPAPPSSTARKPREGHHVSIRSGSYILNPGSDLTNTQTTFGRALASLPPTWSSIESRAPTEAEFETSLTSTDMLLYFGHGSGAQYIRGRTVRRMTKCRAVALLMGCSSASLADVGEFECHGPVWNYMLAGSPAVAGTLWDVTDRDIDRFAGSLFEKWGLLPQGTFSPTSASASASAADGGRRGRRAGASAGKGKDKGASKGRDAARSKSRSSSSGNSNSSGGAECESKTSLVEAVVKARTACRFRYLTAAAVVVYGIPVYIGK